jgi:hypothetical protein
LCDAEEDARFEEDRRTAPPLLDEVDVALDELRRIWVTGGGCCM